MNNITSALVPTTVGSIAISLMASTWDGGNNPRDPLVLQRSIVQYGGALGTFGQFGNFSSRFAALPERAGELISFYSELLANQEDLGHEFEKILFDNIWDLYAR
jgi:hypothetical protein